MVGTHTPFEMVHRNTMSPTISPVTEDVGLLAFTRLPTPLIIVHIPVPLRGVFPAKAADVLQIV